MANALQTPAPVSNPAPWNPDEIFPVLADPARRRLLLALARGGPQAGALLMHTVGKRLSATVKHLTAMRAAGLLVMETDPADGRRMRYGLSPAVPLMKTGTGAVIDFGFCLLRL